MCVVRIQINIDIYTFTPRFTLIFTLRAMLGYMLFTHIHTFTLRFTLISTLWATLGCVLFIFKSTLIFTRSH